MRGHEATGSMGIHLEVIAESIGMMDQPRLRAWLETNLPEGAASLE